MKFNVFMVMFITTFLLFTSCLKLDNSTSFVGNQKQVLPEFRTMSGTGVLTPSTTKSFSFAIFGDNQGGEEAQRISNKIFKEISDQKPAFAFSLGDIVKGKDPQDPLKYIEKKFEEFLARASVAGVPMFNAPGNHELDDKNDIPSQRMQDIYHNYVGPTYGAFDYANSHFIALNTEEVPPSLTPPPPKGVEFSYMGDKQLRLLDADLNANRDKTHIFIMMHYPMKPKEYQNRLNPDTHKKLSVIFKKYTNISYILASHEHIFYNPQDPENTTSVKLFSAGENTKYLISGGGGAGLWESEHWAFHHYLMFHVDGDEISVNIHRVN